MTDEPSFQDLLDQFGEETFVGRTEQLKLFDTWLTAERPPFLILALSGQGGVGKSTLLGQYQRKANAAGAVAVHAEEGQLTPQDVLAHMAEQLRYQDLSCGSYEQGCEEYRELREQVEVAPEAPNGARDRVVGRPMQIGLRSLTRIPLAGTPDDALSVGGIARRKAEATSAFAEYIRETIPDRDGQTLLLETERELTRRWVFDLARIATNRRVFLCFDTYEQTMPGLDQWLRMLLRGEYGRFSAQISFIIAGRGTLGQAWTPFSRAIRRVELEPFSVAEAQTFLVANGVTGDVEQQHLIELSERLPVLLALLVNTSADTPQSVAATAVDRFLQGLSAVQRKAALVAAIPRYFDQDTLAVLLGDVPASASFDWLVHAHFVRETEDGWHYHDVVRHLLLTFVRRRSQSEYAGHHRKLADFYGSRLASQGRSPTGELPDNASRKARLEFLYHELSADLAQGWPVFVDAFLNDTTDLLVSLRSSAETAADQRQKLNTLAQIADELGDAASKHWANVLAELLAHDAAGDLSEADVAAVRTFVDGQLTGNRQASMGRTLLAEIQRRSGAVDAALESAQAAHDADPRNPLARYCRGRILFDLGEYAAAAETFAGLIEEQFNAREAIFWCGRNYFAAGEYGAAIAHFTQLIQMQPEEGDNYYWRGRTHLAMEAHEAARADFTRAIELQPEDGYNYFVRGRTHLAMEAYAPALADFTRAIELQPEYASSYAWRGKTHFEMQAYPSALVDFTEAIARLPDSEILYRTRGITYFTLDSYASALADFSYALTLKPDDGETLYWRGRSQFEVRNFEAAVADLTRAIELLPEEDTSVYWRGRALQAMGEWAQAVADYTCVIEHNPANGYNYIARGGAYLDAAAYLPALADFARAVELVPDFCYGHYLLGATLCTMGDRVAAPPALQKAVTLWEARPANERTPETDLVMAVVLYAAVGNLAVAQRYAAAAEEALIAATSIGNQLDRVLRYLRTFPGDDAGRRIVEALRSRLEQRLQANEP